MSDRSHLSVVPGGKTSEPGFVCTWCGKSYPSRERLNEHHETDPRCRTHARVNNQTQSKYGMADTVQDVPGERALTRIRSAECDHPLDMRELLFASDGRGGWTDEVVGWRCGWCYIVKPIEPSEG